MKLKPRTREFITNRVLVIIFCIIMFTMGFSLILNYNLIEAIKLYTIFGGAFLGSIGSGYILRLMYEEK